MEDIELLYTYKDQVELYEEETESDPNLRGVIVKTVDGSQGSEWPIVILNTVRAGSNALGHTRDRRRVNAAMTRARQGFVLVCGVCSYSVGIMLIFCWYYVGVLLVFC